MNPNSFSPADPLLWLTRPLGYWEKQMIMEVPSGPEGSKFTVNNVTHIVTNQEMDFAKFKLAIQGTVYNEPHFRADVNLKTDPPCWVPADDFSEVVNFQDVTGEGHKTVGDVWPLVLAETKRPWDYGSGKPLYRCTLVRVVGGYVVMNCYHHAAGDGTSGMLVMGGIMGQYQTLWSGGELVLNPHTPRPCVEDLTKISTETTAVVDSLVDAKVSLGKEPRTFLPFTRPGDVQPVESCTLWREGTVGAYQALRQRCKVEQVTVGSLTLAASYLGQAVVHAESLSQDEETYTGMEDQVVDIPVNMRRHLDPVIGDQYCGNYITLLTTKLSVNLSTKLWSLAREIGQKMKDMIAEKQHFLFSQAKEMFENGENSHLAASATPEMILSNLRFYPFQLDFEWGNIRTIHTAVATYCAPGFPPFLLELQSTNMLTYNMAHWHGETNTAMANKLVDIIVGIIETCGETTKDYSLKDLLVKMKN